MTLIDGDRIITAYLYDDEYELFTDKEMSIVDFINAYTEEGVTMADDVLDNIRAEINEYKSRQLTLAIGADDLEKGKQIAIEYVLAIINKYKAESEGNR